MSYIETILNFLSSKQAIIIGATATITQVVIMIVNCIRKVMSENKDLSIKLEEVKKTVSTFSHFDHANTKISKPKLNYKSIFKWSVNPMNIFKKP